MHFTILVITILTSWAAIGLAAPIPLPQFIDPSEISGQSELPTPPAADNPYITKSTDGINAHASPLGTYHQGTDGTYASGGLGTYEKSNKGSTLSGALGSIEKSKEATTYSSALGSFTYGKDGVKLEGPKPKPKKTQGNVPQNVPQGVPQDFGPGAGWS